MICQRVFHILHSEQKRQSPPKTNYSRNWTSIYIFWKQNASSSPYIYIYKSWNQNRSYIVISYIYGTATYYIQIDYVFSKALGLQPWISTANIRGQLLCCVGWTWHLDLDYSTIRFSSRKMGLFSTGFLSRPATHLYLSSELKLQALPAWNYSFILIIEFGTKNGDAHPSFKIHI